MRKTRLFSKYIWIAIAIFLIALAAASLSSMLLRLVHFSEGQSGVIADMISGVIAAIAAGLVLYELKGNEQERIRQNNIEESSFILQYNQTFIQDPNMAEVESLLERNAFYGLASPIITDENRQKFVNYLVYLEGLAPVILNGVLNLDHIDNLMAYRFFLAMNNLEVQEKELIPYADYYRGCFKLYEIWKTYRLQNHLEIPLGENSLDRKVLFRAVVADRSDSRLSFKQLTASDSLSKEQYRDIATLIYQTDPYIYPALFTSNEEPLKAAQIVLPALIAKGTDPMFRKENFFVLFAEDVVVGLVLWHRGKLTWNPEDFIEFASKCGVQLNENSVYAVGNEYIGGQYTEVPRKTISLINICINEHMHGVKLGDLMLKSFIEKHKRNDMELCVLSDNKSAIQLYMKYGFRTVEKTDGFSLDDNKPSCFRMHRSAAER